MSLHSKTRPPKNERTRLMKCLKAQRNRKKKKKKSRVFQAQRYDGELLHPCALLEYIYFLFFSFLSE